MSEMVTRFAPAHAIYIAESDNGGFVRFSDYAALERRASIAIRALCNARGYANELQKQLLGTEDETVAEYLVEAEREIDAELAKKERER